MNIGAMNSRVVIQSQSTTQDEIGQPVDVWIDEFTVWASVKDVSGREFVAAGGVQSAAQTKILIRHRSGVAPAMRAVCGGTTYNIQAVLVQDKASMLLMCERLAS